MDLLGADRWECDLSLDFPDTETPRVDWDQQIRSVAARVTLIDSPDDWVLQYPPAYPLYRALETAPVRRGGRLSGVSAFVVDVCAEGIIEWAMEPLDDGDSSRLEDLLGDAPDGADPGRWEDYCEKMMEMSSLRRSQQQVDRYGHLLRECAALSLSLFEGHS